MIVHLMKFRPKYPVRLYWIAFPGLKINLIETIIVTLIANLFYFTSSMSRSTGITALRAAENDCREGPINPK